jgi:DNA mismatch endonuclease (patch repair protein)
MRTHEAFPMLARSKRQSEETSRPKASSEAVRKRMQSTPQRDTPAELRIRQLLHAMGLRYSVDAKPLFDSPRRADVIFRRAKVAVFVDGCFWHGCPVHGPWPKANAAFWRDKIDTNRRRDADTDEQLRSAGWRVVRVWEYEDPTTAARLIRQEIEGPWYV